MANILSPKILRRGLEFSLLASLLGFAAVLLYRGNYKDFVASLAHIRPLWLLVGAAVSSMDWIGGGLRHWVISRHVWQQASVKAMIVAGGMGAWAGYLTPVHAGASVVRSMPNTPGQIGEGITVWTASKEVTEEQQEMARAILGALGEEVFVEDENYLDMATALSGS